MNFDALAKVRQLGLTESNGQGIESVRLSAQLRKSLLGYDRTQRRTVLDAWQRRLRDQLIRYGGEVVPDSLSLSGQTVDIRVPMASIHAMRDEVEQDETRLDLILPNNATLAG